MVSIINQNVTAATTKKLITFTNDRDKTRVDLYINLDNGHNFKNFVLKYSNDETDKIIDNSDLKNGRVIYTDKNVDIIEISANNFDVGKGGTIQLEYLKKYPYTTDVLVLNLEKSNTWHLKYKGSQVSSAKIISNTFLGTRVGIKKFVLK